MSHPPVDELAVSILYTACDDSTAAALSSAAGIDEEDAAAAFVTALQQAAGDCIVVTDAAGRIEGSQLAVWAGQLRSSGTDRALIAAFTGLDSQTAEPGATSTDSSGATAILGRLFLGMETLMTQPAVLVFRKQALEPEHLRQALQHYRIRHLLRPFLFLHLLHDAVIEAHLPFRPALVTGAAPPLSAELALECMALFDFACRNGQLKSIRTYAQAVRNLHSGLIDALRGLAPASAPAQPLLQRAAELEAILGKFMRLKPLFSEVADHACPACQHRVIRFVPLPLAIMCRLAEHGYLHALNDHETLNASQYSCPVCRASDYERLSALHLRARMATAGVKKYRMLHLAPSPAMSQCIVSMRCFETTPAQRQQQGVDMTELRQYADHQFDCFVCSMVLDQQADDRAALRELHRVLRPGGWGILMVPIVRSLSTVQESAISASAAERWAQHGHGERVRSYSRHGFLERVRLAGLQVEALGVEHFGAAAFRQAGIGCGSVLYVVTKQAGVARHNAHHPDPDFSEERSMTAPALPQFAPESAEFRSNPYAAYKAFRELDPVFQRREQGDWIVTGHAAVKHWLASPQRQASPQSALNEGADTDPAAEPEAESVGQALTAAADYHFRHGLHKATPPRHTQLRKIIADYFSKDYFNRLKPAMQAMAHDLLEQQWPQRQLDVNEDFAFPFTSSIICHMLGLPLADRNRMREWSYHYQLSLNLLHSRKDVLRRDLSLAAMASWLRPIIAARMECPADDFISYLAQQHLAGHVSYEALIGNIMTLILGGFENTQNGICLAIYHMLQHPDQLQLLRGNASLLPLAAEECLRFDPPLQCFYTDSYQGQLGTRHIGPGQRVHLLFGAANRDPAVYLRPDELDITRLKNPHLTLGHGIHYCLGAQLARMEIEIAMQTLLLDMSGMALRDTTLHLNPLFSIKSVKHVFVSF